jgi:hypothetical protein
MTRFRIRPMPVDALHFDGTRAAAAEVTAWLESVAPEIIVRERIEYAGWDDREGHVELELHDHEAQCAKDDWIVITDADGVRRSWVVDDRTFRRYFTPTE